MAAIIIGINIYFVGYYVTTAFPPYWFVYFGVIVFGVLYLTFITYLLLHMFVSMGFTGLSRFEVRQPLVIYLFAYLFIYSS